MKSRTTSRETFWKGRLGHTVWSLRGEVVAEPSKILKVAGKRNGEQILFKIGSISTFGGFNRLVSNR